MQYLLTAVALLALPVSAHAQAFGNVAGCERATGQEESTDNLFVLWPDRIERWESLCKIVSVEGDLNVRALISTECSGEGDTWKQIYSITPVGNDAYSIWSTDNPELIFELRPCE